jgi:hypothetical protein
MSYTQYYIYMIHIHNIICITHIVYIENRGRQVLSQLATEDDPRCLAGLMGATADPAAEVRAAAVRAVQAVARPGNRAAIQVCWDDGERVRKRARGLHEMALRGVACDVCVVAVCVCASDENRSLALILSRADPLSR